MMGSLEIAVAQPETVPFDVAGNAARHAVAIWAARSRVVVFPEMSLTGYEFDAGPIDPSDLRLSPISEACRETGSIALAGGPVDAGGDQLSIGVIMFDGSESRVVYRKIWLGQLEATRYVPGITPVVIEVDGWRLGLAVCKDTGEADHASETAMLGMDVYVAGVLEHAHDRDVQPARARRVANAHSVWVAIASFAGAAGEGFDVAAGGSGIWRPDGMIVARADGRPGEIAAAVLNPKPSPDAMSLRLIDGPAVSGMKIEVDSDGVDWDALHTLVRAAYRYMDDRIDPPSSLHDMSAADFQRKALDETLITAISAGELVGCLFCRPAQDWLYVGKMAVAADLQQRGVGRLLMEQARALASELGLAGLELETRIELSENHEAFAKMGFVKVADQSHAGFTRVTNIRMQAPLKS